MANVEAKKCDHCNVVEHGDRLTKWVGLAHVEDVVIIGPIEAVKTQSRVLDTAAGIDLKVCVPIVEELCGPGCLQQRLSEKLVKGSPSTGSFDALLAGSRPGDFVAHGGVKAGEVAIVAAKIDAGRTRVKLGTRVDASA